MEPEPEMQDTVDYEDPELLVKLIQSNDLKDKELLNTIVIKIMKERNEPLFALLLANDYTMEVLNEKGQTALHYAFYNWSYYNFNRRFLDREQLKNDSCDHTDSNGLSHLHIACDEQSGNFLELIKTYVRNGSNINACYHSDPTDFYSQFTPLHFAMGHGNCEIIQFLLENGANANAVDSKGRTPLHLACRNSCKGMLQIVELLINNFNADIEARDQRGHTPLLSMFDYPDPDPDETLRVKDVQSKFDALLKNGANIMAKNNKGDTVLHLLIKTLSLELCNFCLPTDSSYKNHHHAEFVKQILDYNIELLDAKNIEGQTPLQFAISMTNADIVKILLDHGADVSLINFDSGNEQIFCYPGIVPQYQTVNNIMTIVNLIIDKGFELNGKDHLIILKFLVHESGDCDCSDSDNLQQNMLIRTTALLNCGTTQHAKQILNQLRENNTNDFSSIIYHLWVYLKMMKNANFYLDREMEKILTALTLHYHGQNVDLPEKELLHLKTNIKLKNGMMLYDLMKKHPYTAPSLLTEDNFDYKLIDDFKEYKDIIKGHITKAIVRNYIVKSAYDYLQLTSLSSLPDICIDMILSFLSNADIYKLCSTVFVQDSKDAVQNV